MVEPDLNPASLVPESLLLYYLCDTIRIVGGGGTGTGRLYVMVNRKVLDSGPSAPVEEAEVGWVKRIRTGGWSGWRGAA